MSKIIQVINNINYIDDLYNLMKSEDVEISDAAISRIEELINTRQVIFSIRTMYFTKACTPKVIRNLLEGKSSYFERWLTRNTNYEGYSPKKGVKLKRKVGELRGFEVKDLKTKAMLKNIVSLFMKEGELEMYLAHPKGWVREVAQKRFMYLSFLKRTRG